MKTRMKAILLVALLLAFAAVTFAFALDYSEEHPVTIDCWVLCQPDSYVNVRESARRNSAVIGRAYTGDRFETDGKCRDGFLHVYCSLEQDEGWIAIGYIVTDEPRPVNELWIVESNGRVACRKTIDGARRCWVVNGSTLTVYWMSDSWAVTDKGFIKSEFIWRGW